MAADDQVDPFASAAVKAFVRRNLSRPAMLEGGPVPPRDYDPRAFPLAPPPAASPDRQFYTAAPSQGYWSDIGAGVNQGLPNESGVPIADGPALPQPADKSQYTYSIPEDPNSAQPTFEQRSDSAAERAGLHKRVIQSSPLLPGDLPPTPIYGAYNESSLGEPTGGGGAGADVVTKEAGVRYGPDGTPRYVPPEINGGGPAGHPLVGTLPGGAVGFSDSPAFLQMLSEKDPAKRAELRKQADVEQMQAMRVAGERQQIALQRSMAAAQAPRSAEEKARLIEAEGNTSANLIRAGAARTTAEAGAAKTGAETAQLDPATLARAQYLNANPNDFEGADRYAMQIAASQGKTSDYGAISEEEAKQLAAKQSRGWYERAFAHNKILNAQDVDLSQASIVPSARWHIFHNLLGTGTSMQVPDPKGGPGAVETYQTDSAEEEAKLRAAIDFVKARKALRPVTGRDDEMTRKPRY